MVRAGPRARSRDLGLGFMIVAGPWPGYGPHFPGGRIDPGNVRWNRVL